MIAVATLQLLLLPLKAMPMPRVAIAAVTSAIGTEVGVVVEVMVVIAVAVVTILLRLVLHNGESTVTTNAQHACFYCVSASAHTLLLALRSSRLWTAMVPTFPENLEEISYLSEI
jgi:hypothetical protein